MSDESETTDEPASVDEPSRRVSDDPEDRQAGDPEATDSSVSTESGDDTEAADDIDGNRTPPAPAGSQSLSPFSVPYRVVQRGGSILAAAAFVLYSGTTSTPFGFVGPVAVFGLLGGAVFLLTGYEVAYFRRYAYELAEDTLEIRSGVFARREREIPLRRIQNVDISRNVVQRIFGIAAVDFETAGGTETEASIRFVDFEEAKRLQREISRLKRGATTESAKAVAAEELFVLSDGELALAGVLSFDVRVPGLLFVLVSGSVSLVSSFIPIDPRALLATGLLGVVVVAVVLFSWIAGAVVTVVNYHGFRLTRTGEELQYERGLFQRYDGSIPMDKVQTLTIKDNPLKRRFGYATLAIETAGYAPGQGGERGSQAAVPIARRDRVLTLANALEPFGDPAFERPPRRVRRRYVARYLIGLGLLTAALFAVDRGLSWSIPWYASVVLLPVVPVVAHFKWLHRGYWLGDDHVVTRNGMMKRETKIVPYYRIQTIIDSRTIFQRRWNLATVTIDTAASTSVAGQDAAAVDVDRETADRLRADLDERLGRALATRRRHRSSMSSASWPDEPHSAL